MSIGLGWALPAGKGGSAATAATPLGHEEHSSNHFPPVAVVVDGTTSTSQVTRGAVLAATAPAMVGPDDGGGGAPREAEGGGASAGDKADRAWPGAAGCGAGGPDPFAAGASASTCDGMAHQGGDDPTGQGIPTGWPVPGGEWPPSGGAADAKQSHQGGWEPWEATDDSQGPTTRDASAGGPSTFNNEGTRDSMGAPGVDDGGDSSGQGHVGDSSVPSATNIGATDGTGAAARGSGDAAPRTFHHETVKISDYSGHPRSAPLMLCLHIVFCFWVPMCCFMAAENVLEGCERDLATFLRLGSLCSFFAGPLVQCLVVLLARRSRWARKLEVVESLHLLTAMMGMSWMVWSWCMISWTSDEFCYDENADHKYDINPRDLLWWFTTLGTLAAAFGICSGTVLCVISILIACRGGSGASALGSAESRYAAAD